MNETYQRYRQDPPLDIQKTGLSGLSDVGFPEPLQNLSASGQITPDEESLAKAFYKEVYQSDVLLQLVDAESSAGEGDEIRSERAEKVCGIFALLDSIDEKLLATVCALVLELRINGSDEPLNLEEVGRRVMRFDTPEANQAAGAALMRAALWIIRFGYRNPELCKVLLSEKQLSHRSGSSPLNFSPDKMV